MAIRFSLLLLPLALGGLAIAPPAAQARRDRHADMPPLERIEQHQACPGCDLRYFDLRGMDLSGINLEDANFYGANLTGANLDGATLTNANFGYANLSGASLIGANLHRASFLDAVLAGADLSGANLQRTYLGYADLRSANLSGANLSGANLWSVRTEGLRTCGAILPNGISLRSTCAAEADPDAPLETDGSRGPNDLAPIDKPAQKARPSTHPPS
ncbi:MAG: pentapeptide repeat-containing protein [Cyanobacteria bacterium]|nr:pentapeptide repeat-containing protein [Cyanobacteriota bacterium]